MLIKASQRSGAAQLARHLMNGEQNEHVEVHEIKGFLSGNLEHALKESEAVSKGTKCRQFLFSVSLNPPEHEYVGTEIFEDTIETIEARLGLEGQPRAVVFHEKEGRRHAHCVWSRIDTESMTAINMDYFKSKLKDISKEIYLDRGWDLPKGYLDGKDRDPRNFSHEQWQQARRMEIDPRLIKDQLKQAWGVSDSRESFRQALEERGFFLAKGDRKGFVVMDYRCEVMSLSRWTGLKAKELKARLGDGADLPGVQETTNQIAGRMTEALRRMERDVRKSWAKDIRPLREEKRAMRDRHRQERVDMKDMQRARWANENAQRTQRISKGFKGLWHKITGKHKRIRLENEREAAHGRQRDRQQREALQENQREERRELQDRLRQQSERFYREHLQLRREMAHYLDMRDDRDRLGQAFRDKGRDGDGDRDNDSGQDPDQDRGPGKDNRNNKGIER